MPSIAVRLAAPVTLFAALSTLPLSAGAHAAEPVASDASETVADRTWVSPAIGPLGRRFGPQPTPPSGWPLHYNAQDIEVCHGDVRAASAGVVTFAGVGPDDQGVTVTIDHGSGIVPGHPDAVIATEYEHLREGSATVAAGEYVETGQLLGISGDTGWNEGCKLSFAVEHDGYRVDPLWFMADQGVILGEG